MSTTDVELLKQSLKILIEDFQSFKTIVYRVVGATILFIATTIVSAVLILVK